MAALKQILLLHYLVSRSIVQNINFILNQFEMSKVCRFGIFLSLFSLIALAAAQNPPNVCANPPQGAIIMKDDTNATYGSLTINADSNVVILQNINYGCTSGTNPWLCNVNIVASTICFMNNVQLLYPQIILNASAIYINSSNVNASGMILSGKGKGSTAEFGYSYAGFGGYCGDTSNFPSYAYSQMFPTYGSYDDTWNVSDAFDTFGTGYDSNIGFGGGGKIVIQAVDSLEILNSQVAATGTANCSHMSTERARAGTGGYIFVSMLNDSGVLNLTTTFFNVSGGLACNRSTSYAIGYF